MPAYEIRRKLTKSGAVRFYRVRGRNRMTGLLQWVQMPKAQAELDLASGAAELVAS